MNRSQAEELRVQMRAEHPDRETHSFILSERDGVWTVAKVALPPRPGAPTPIAATETQGISAPLQSGDGTTLPGGIPRSAGL